MGGVNKKRPPLGVTDSGAPVVQYSSSTNRAQYSLTQSSKSDSVKRVQQRQRSLAEGDLEENIYYSRSSTSKTGISSAESSGIKFQPSQTW